MLDINKKIPGTECNPDQHYTDTYYANIYVGLQKGYDGPVQPLEAVYALVQDVCNMDDVCGGGRVAVTVTPTTFIYPNGREPGAIVGLINYPRYPKSRLTIQQQALYIARLLKEKLGQERLSVVFPDMTVMLGSM